MCNSLMISPISRQKWLCSHLLFKPDLQLIASVISIMGHKSCNSLKAHSLLSGVLAIPLTVLLHHYYHMLVVSIVSVIMACTDCTFSHFKILYDFGDVCPCWQKKECYHIHLKVCTEAPSNISNSLFCIVLPCSTLPYHTQLCGECFSFCASSICPASTVLCNTLKSETIGCPCYGTVGFSRQRERETDY